MVLCPSYRPLCIIDIYKMHGAHMCVLSCMHNRRILNDKLIILLMQHATVEEVSILIDCLFI